MQIPNHIHQHHQRDDPQEVVALPVLQMQVPVLLQMQMQMQMQMVVLCPVVGIRFRQTLEELIYRN